MTSGDAATMHPVRRRAALLAAGALALGAGGFALHAEMSRERDETVAARAAHAAAEARAAALAAKVEGFEHLALVVEHERLLMQEGELVPAHPEQRAAIADWVQRAQQLLDQEEALAAAVAAARRSMDQEAAGPAKPSRRAEWSARFLAQTLTALIEKLPQLAARTNTMRQRERWAAAIGPLMQAHPNAKVTWAEARAAIAAHPLYQGQDLRLDDVGVLGLVPIGANPQSGLWEFYDLRSAWDGAGDLASLPIPTHGPAGRIAMTDASGIVWVLLPGGTLPEALSPHLDDFGEIDAGAELRGNLRLAPFLIAKHEVTQAQWMRWTGANPSASSWRNYLTLPVENVDWFQCRDVLAQFGLALPSELQCEYAMRAGTDSPWWSGYEVEDLLLAENLGDREPKLLPVGSKLPNPFGLFDMHGNAAEWCSDELGEFGGERPGDGRRPEPAYGPMHRCFRSGCFVADPGYAHSGSRYFGVATIRNGNLGVRPVRLLPE